MATKPIAARLPEEVVDHVEEVANSPATDLNTPSAVVRRIVTDSFN